MVKYCPRCGAPMELNIEKSVSHDGSIRFNYFYRCKGCGFRLDDAILVMKRVEGGYQATAVELG
ncbi:MAG: hypothetical protein GXO07_04655 [Crenarchaeota archaeon]|nr:hypothetical protein [Thermoproteota archaeon]